MSSHSSHRTRAQWARHHGDDFSVISNIGGWKDVSVLRFFMWAVPMTLAHRKEGKMMAVTLCGFSGSLTLTLKLTPQF